MWPFKRKKQIEALELKVDMLTKHLTMVVESAKVLAEQLQRTTGDLEALEGKTKTFLGLTAWEKTREKKDILVPGGLVATVLTSIKNSNIAIRGLQRGQLHDETGTKEAVLDSPDNQLS